MRTGKFVCPDCRKNMAKPVPKDASPCVGCGKRICNDCHTSQASECRHCQTYATVLVR